MTRRPARSRVPTPRHASWLARDGTAAPAPAAERRLERLAWGLTALLAAGLLAMVFGPHRIGDYMTESDFYGAYAQGARLLQSGRLDPTRYGVVGPVYEATLALVGLVIRNLFLAAQLISVAAAAATLLLWFGLLRRRADARVALAAALFLAANPYLFRYGYAATTDALAVALQAAALFLLLTTTGARAMAGAGIVAALAFLTRYNAGYLLPAGLAVLLAGGGLEPRRGRAALLFAVGFAAPVLPWVLFSLAHGGRFEFQLHHNLAYEVFARARGIQWDVYQRDLQPQFRTLWDVIARDPGAVTARLIFNVGDHLRLDARNLLGWPTAASAAAGLLLAAWDRSLRKLWPLLLAGALAFLTLVPVFYSERYSLALLPIYAALAGVAFGSPRLALAVGGARPVWLKTALLALPLAFSARASVRLEARTLDQLPVEVLECAKTLERLKQPGDRVIARKGHIGYHAGVEVVAFPFADSLPQLAAAARREHARWLFFSWPEAETRPAFWYLLDTSGVVPGLTPRCVAAPHGAVLYEIGPGFGTRPAWFANDTLRTLHTGRARLRVDPGDPEGLFMLGAVAMSRGDFAEARERLEGSVRRAPRHLQAWLALGSVALHMNDASAGAAAYDRALELAPGSLEARIGRGWASLVGHRAEEAAALWRPVVAKTRDPVTLERMIEVYQALGDREAAAVAQRTLALVGGGR